MLRAVSPSTDLDTTINTVCVNQCYGVSEDAEMLIFHLVVSSLWA